MLEKSRHGASYSQRLKRSNGPANLRKAPLDASLSFLQRNPAVLDVSYACSAASVFDVLGPFPPPPIHSETQSLLDLAPSKLTSVPIF